MAEAVWCRWQHVSFVRAFGGIAARNGATLTGDSISSVASRNPSVSGTIAGEIADRSLAGYMPQLQGQQLKDTQITGGQISTTSIGADGKSTALEMYNTSQFEKPDAPHSVVTASDGSQWYQMASGAGAGAFMMRRHLWEARQKRHRLQRLFPMLPREQPSGRLAMA